MLRAIQQEWDRRLRRPEDYFVWPSTAAEEGDHSLRQLDWPETGVLAFLGYAVGRTHGIHDAARELILAEIFSGSLPPVHSPDYMLQWGSPKTAGRLRKTAETIAALTRNAKRRRDMRLADAIREWERDLKFLYDRYYVGPCRVCLAANRFVAHKPIDFLFLRARKQRFNAALCIWASPLSVNSVMCRRLHQLSDIRQRECLTFQRAAAQVQTAQLHVLF